MDISPETSLALGIARADLQYACGALLRPADPTSGWLFVQWAVMTAYEALPHLSAVAGGDQHDPVWDPDAAKAARMAGKFFDDKKRTIEELADYFDRLKAANRGEFFPANRRGRMFDFLRTDLAVLLHDDIPVMTNISGFFATGVSPEGLLAYDELGERGRRLTEQVGRTLVRLGGETTHGGPASYDPDSFKWRDVDSAKLSWTVFAGMFETPMALAMLTIQGAARAAYRLSSSACCGECVAAAMKFRYVVTYQALVSLRRLRASPMLPTAAEPIIDSVFDVPACTKMLTDGYRRLRNGWLHLGLTDARPEAGAFDLEAVLQYYTGEPLMQIAEVSTTALGAVSAVLDQWCMTPKNPSKPLSSILHVPGP